MADKYLIAEEAYKNGYEAGKRDAVVHGCWIPVSDDEVDEDVYYCSNCKREDYLLFKEEYVYCPFCGAKMENT